MSEPDERVEWCDLEGPEPTLGWACWRTSSGRSGRSPVYKGVIPAGHFDDDADWWHALGDLAQIERSGVGAAVRLKLTFHTLPIDLNVDRTSLLARVVAHDVGLGRPTDVLAEPLLHWWAIWKLERYGLPTTRLAVSAIWRQARQGSPVRFAAGILLNSVVARTLLAKPSLSRSEARQASEAEREVNRLGHEYWLRLALEPLASRGEREETRLRKAGKLGGRKPKADRAALSSAVDAYLAGHPSHSVTAAEQVVAQDFGVGVRTVQRARAAR